MNGPKQKVKLLVQIVLVALAYFIFGKLGLRLAVVQSNATAVWAPTGIAIAMFLIFGRRIWPAIFLGALFVNVTTAGTVLPVAFFIAVGNTLEGLLAMVLVNRFVHGLHAFDRTEDVFKFAFFAGVVAPLVSATVGVTALAVSGSLAWAHYFPAWSTWWVGDFGGAVIVAPLILLWYIDHSLSLSRARVVEVIFFIGFIVIFSFLVLQDQILFIYLTIPVLIWGALRFTRRETVTAVFILTEVSLWGTLHGLGPFAPTVLTPDAINGSVMLLGASMATTLVTMLVLVALVTQITREKLVDEAVLSNVGAGLIMVNGNTDIVFANREAEGMFGIPLHEMVGRRYQEVVAVQEEDGTPVPLAEQAILRALSGGERIMSNPFARKEYYLRTDGRRFPVWSVTTAVIRDDATIGAIEMFMDITEQRSDEGRITDFMALASHELRTPLSVIGLSSELLRNQGQLFGKYDEREVGAHLEDIQGAARQMADIINDLFNVSRIESRNLAVRAERIDVQAAVQKVMEGLKPKIKRKQLQVTFMAPKEIPALISDRGLFVVIMQNLLSNAVKYTKEGDRIRVTLTAEGDGVTIVVADSGYGIPEKEQGKIFTKLYRASNAKTIEREGSGLGLYITKAMVERLGGTISFVSQEELGSTFIVRLPQLAAAQTASIEE